MLKEKLQKFFKLDRRWIFLLLAIVLFAPIIKPIGLPNKTIAYDLKISARTVEVHRANLMARMGAGSLADLVRMAFVVRSGLR